MAWDGKRWDRDHKRMCFRLAREVCREAAKTEKTKAEKRRIATAKTRAAIVNLAQDDERLSATIDQWDADPWLLNTPDGIVDLKTGHLRPHDHSAFMSKMCAVGPDFGMETPLWNAFLKRITDCDDDLRAYLQRLTGYSLTGLTSEQMLSFLYGGGGNGKGVFINALVGVLADYHRKVPVEALLLTYQERHPTELAGLKGARLVTADEVPQSRNWNESQVKTLTGGDVITARGMRQDFFDFTPQFTLIVSGNHKPNLKSVDYAIRRRLQLVPFLVTIPKEEVDPHLGEKLKAEWPGILAWMVRGCLEWQERGLLPPEVVVEETERYLSSQDLTTEFLGEYYVRDASSEAARSSAFELWKIFCEQRAEKPGRQRDFIEKIEKAGFRTKNYMDRDEKGKRIEKKIFVGLRRNNQEEPKTEDAGAINNEGLEY